MIVSNSTFLDISARSLRLSLRLSPHFLFYEAVSLPRCVPCSCHKILRILCKLIKVCVLYNGVQGGGIKLGVSGERGVPQPQNNESMPPELQVV